MIASNYLDIFPEGISNVAYFWLLIVQYSLYKYLCMYAIR